MKAKFVVLDASVILKWVLPYENERHAEGAYTIRDLYGNGLLEIKLPTIWAYEIGNTINRLNPHHAKDLIGDLLSCRFRERSLDKLLATQASSLCQKYKVTFYDACYHAVALEDGGLFVTADNQYFQKAQAAGAVVLLKDFSKNT